MIVYDGHSYICCDANRADPTIPGFAGATSRVPASPPRTAAAVTTAVPATVAASAMIRGRARKGCSDSLEDVLKY